MNFNKTFKAFNRQDQKTVYKLKLDDDNSVSDRRFASEILKLNKDNQYSYFKARPLPTGCVKKHESIKSWKKLNLMLEQPTYMVLL